jgi:hypothetical protein
MLLGLFGLVLALEEFHYLTKNNLPVWPTRRVYKIVQALAFVNIFIGLYLATSLLDLHLPGADALVSYTLLIPAIFIVAIRSGFYYKKRASAKNAHIPLIPKQIILTTLLGVTVIGAIPGVFLVYMIAATSYTESNAVLMNIMAWGYPILIIFLAVLGSKRKSILLAASAAILASLPLVSMIVLEQLLLK